MPDETSNNSSGVEIPKLTTTPTTTLNKMMCCGILEVDNLSLSKTPEEAMRLIYAGANARLPFRSPFLIFSGIVKMEETRERIQWTTTQHPGFRLDDYAKAFADFITKNELGPIVVSGERRNSTGNTLQVYIWEPKWEAITAWVNTPIVPPFDPNLGLGELRRA